MVDTTGLSAEDRPSLAGYEFSRVLGSGTTGTVYLARQSSTGREVAVKVLSPALYSTPGFQERFRAEARLMTRFDDANLVDIFDYVEYDGGAYLVMQYVRGVQLRKVMDEGRKLTPEQSLGVLSGALSGLVCAHRLGVVHGDLKPENVLVDEKGQSMLIDFGQASPAGSRPSGGTPAYASPEAVRDETVDARSDVYGAGLILYELLCGAPPFQGTPSELAKAHRDLIAPRLAGVPGPIADLVARSLSKDPSQRPESAEDFLTQLTDAATDAYGPDWPKRASIAAAAGAVIGSVFGLEVAGAGAAPGAGQAAGIQAAGKVRTLHRVRRLASRIHRAVAAHPVPAAASVAAVGAAAVVLSLIGSQAPVAGAFSAVSASGSPTAITCESASHCWVDLGSAILMIGPGGTRAVSQIPSSDGTVSSVSCATDTFCIAVGTNPSGDGVVLTSDDGGAAWSADSLPSGTGAVSSISCVTGTTQCWAAARSGLLRSDSGRQWSLVTTPSGAGPIGLISCPALNNCIGMAGGVAEATHDGGASWTSASLPGLLYGPSDIDCVTAEVCWVVGEYTNSLQSQIGSVDRTIDGGAIWTRVNIPASPQPYAFDSISCWTANSCLVDGTVEWGGGESSSGSPYFLSTSDAGSTWSVHLAPVTMPFAPEIQCINSTSCWLSGQSGIGFTTDSGASWNVDFYGPKLTLSSVSCTAPGDCFAAGSFPDLVKNHLGGFVLPSANPMAVLIALGTTGSYSAINSTDHVVSGLTDLSCTVDGCVGAGIGSGGYPSVLLDLDTSGKKGPVSIAIPEDVQSLTGVACPVGGPCLVSGQENGEPVLLEQKGAGWSKLALPYGTQATGEITCPVSSRCLVLSTGNSGPMLLDGSLASGEIRWHAVVLPADVHSLTAVDCPTQTACWLAVTVGPSGTKTEILRTLQLTASSEAMSVTSTTTSARATTTTTTASKRTTTPPLWVAQSIPVGVTGVTSIACPTTASCLALGTLSNGSEVLLGAGQVGTVMRGQIASPPTT
jgi:tRNA A-37 threonylcarbamoyl transferase component Bud32